MGQLVTGGSTVFYKVLPLLFPLVAKCRKQVKSHEKWLPSVDKSYHVFKDQINWILLKRVKSSSITDKKAKQGYDVQTVYM